MVSIRHGVERRLKLSDICQRLLTGVEDGHLTAAIDPCAQVAPSDASAPCDHLITRCFCSHAI